MQANISVRQKSSGNKKQRNAEEQKRESVGMKTAKEIMGRYEKSKEENGWA